MKKIIILIVLVSAQAHAGIYFDNLWKTNEVTTCFARGEEGGRHAGDYVLKVREWKQSQKDKVKKWVNEEFTPERTGIHFTGFLDCEESPEAEVVIFHNKNSKLKNILLGGMNGLANLGPNQGSVTGYPLASAYVSISSSGMNKGTVIHEFGHSAGLAHEHIHPDANKVNIFCVDISKSAGYKSYYVYEDYDRDSVMSYCKLNGPGGKKLGLSRGDVELLKKLYP